MQGIRAITSLLVVFACFAASAAKLPVALVEDPPPDRANPPSMASLTIPSHGAELNAMMYLAGGYGPHPVVILLAGFPGNERNLDLAQAMRRAGWNVLYFNYRGSWGSPGVFSFEHCVEDTEAAIEFMHDRGVAEQLHSDPHRIVLIGHSLGGFLAAYGAAHEPYIYGVAMMSAVNLGGMADAQGNPATAVSRLSTHFARSPMEPLKGCTARSLAAEIINHRADWNFDNYAEELAKRPVLLITADDGLYGHEHRLGIALKKHGIGSLTEKHFATDHCYSSTRIELEATVLNWLSSLDSPSDKDDMLRAANAQ